MEMCDNVETCWYHFRNDYVLENEVGYTAITYVDQYVVSTMLMASRTEMLLEAIGFMSVQSFPWGTEVRECGHGSQEDVDMTLPPAYSNKCADPAEAKKLHWELVDLIKAGEFNGADF